MRLLRVVIRTQNGKRSLAGPKPLDNSKTNVAELTPSVADRTVNPSFDLTMIFSAEHSLDVLSDQHCMKICLLGKQPPTWHSQGLCRCAHANFVTLSLKQPRSNVTMRRTLGSKVGKQGLASNAG